MSTTTKATAQRRPAILLAAASALLLSVTVAGCATQSSPATGRTFSSPISTQQEASLGKEEHPKILNEFGGAYTEKADLNPYVNSIGQFLASTGERPDVKFTFTVLNTPDVNAFAVPGGYIYVTRGLMALANNEAEARASLLQLEEKNAILDREIAELSTAQRSFVQLSLFEESFLREKETDLTSLQKRMRTLQDELEAEKSAVIEIANQIVHLKNDGRTKEQRHAEIARDLAPHKIRIVAIAPGTFLSPMVEALPQQYRDALAAGVPHPSRLGRLEEFAEFVETIIGSPMVNGTCIRFDGAARLQ